MTDDDEVVSVLRGMVLREVDALVEHFKGREVPRCVMLDALFNVANLLTMKSRRDRLELVEVLRAYADQIESEVKGNLPWQTNVSKASCLSRKRVIYPCARSTVLPSMKPCPCLKAW